MLRCVSSSQDTGNSEANDNTYEDPTVTFKDTTGKPKEVSDGYSYITLGIDAAAAMATGHGEYASVQQLRRWEVPKGNVRLDQTLGSGQFGLVVKGFLKSEQATQVVAVKMLKGGCAEHFFFFRVKARLGSQSRVSQK